MKYFTSFIKRKGLYLPISGRSSNKDLALQLNHELMTNGYYLSQELFDVLCKTNRVELTKIFNDLVKNISKVTSNSNYVATYMNFPDSVKGMSDAEFHWNAMLYYITRGTLRPDQKSVLEATSPSGNVNYTEIKLISEAEYNSIFTDLVYSNNSLSANDKKIVDYFLTKTDVELNLSKVKFNETLAYIGSKMFTLPGITKIPTRSATNLLRMYAAYSGGDEGLKTNTRFKNPKNRQVNILMRTLDNCYDLEESFKLYREPWLRILFYLNPLTAKNSKKYPNVYRYANILRNNPKLLRTFASYVESYLKDKDEKVFDLLLKRMGVFTRRLDHTVRVFGITAINKWLSGNPTSEQIVTAYNHFNGRDKKVDGRSAVLASQSKSEVVTYKTLEPLDSKLISTIKTKLLGALQNVSNTSLSNKKVYIDPLLYYRPLNVNNRASNLTLSGTVNGTIESVEKANTNTIRMYVHWHGKDDIDLSGLVLKTDGSFIKVGWNGKNNTLNNAILYSGDNTGHASKNAEYIDININNESLNSVEWIITECRIYRGKMSYSRYMNYPVKAGWLYISNPSRRTDWLPDNVAQAMVLSTDSSVQYLQAYHPKSGKIVYLDLSLGSGSVSTNEDGNKLRIYLNRFLSSLENEEVNWDVINQGHLLNLMSESVVNEKDEADIVFDENTTLEAVTKFLN